MILICSNCGLRCESEGPEIDIMCPRCKRGQINFLVSKPPLGVMPKKIWIYKRVEDLSRAIQEYVAYGDLHSVRKWASEIVELLGEDM